MALIPLSYGFDDRRFVRPRGHRRGSTYSEVEVERRPGKADEIEQDRLWLVSVWNDPINLMSYATLVFPQLLGYSKQRRRG